MNASVVDAGAGGGVACSVVAAVMPGDSEGDLGVCCSGLLRGLLLQRYRVAFHAARAEELAESLRLVSRPTAPGGLAARPVYPYLYDGPACHLCGHDHEWRECPLHRQRGG